MKATTKEMFLVSSFLYGGVSFFGLLGLLFPTWPELDSTSIAIFCSIGLIFSMLFYAIKNTAPIWLAIVHIPLGIMMVSWVIYLGHAEQSTSLAVIYVISSAYLFHYVKLTYALFVLAFSMLLYAFVLSNIGVEGWQAIVVFVMGNCLTIGLIVRLITKRMHALNIKDALTGLLNRQTINALTNNLLQEKQYQADGMVFIVIDLNQFKLINDTKGHLEGDKILIEFSRILQASVIQGGHVARWGGDEFIVILKVNSSQDVKTFEENLRRDTQYTIGFEMGISYLREGDTLDSLMCRADQNMYRNKHNRRATD